MSRDSQSAITPLPYTVQVPETFGYRIKRALLGPPIVTERISAERMSKPIALGVLSSDCVSSSAYGSEEMLRILVPVIGAAAFTLVLPVTGVILIVLLLLTLSYRDVVMVYTKAGGSYVVARENFGTDVAQIAAVALLIDYTVTVAVQASAGTDAVLSLLHLAGHSPTAFGLDHVKLELTVAVVLLLCYGNLRGLREAGRIFAAPFYLFTVAAGSVVLVGLVRAAFGGLPHVVPQAGALPLGHSTGGFLYGASLFIVLRSFANGGSSLTGLEAISNGVATFRRPEGRNARRTLVIMSSILAFLVGGVSLLAYFTHAIPYADGSPTVIAQEARVVFGSGAFGTVLFILVQLATALILYTGGNTSFNGFPYLASFVAGDRFLPRQLTHRGHRLAFSNGIITLTVVSVALLLVTASSVDKLVAFYAIGVFTGFVMAAAGLFKYHWSRRERHRMAKLIINGAAAILSAVVVIVFAITKFTEGAWLVVVIFPLGVLALIRLNHRYQAEADALEAVPAISTPPRRPTAVIVLVDSLDLAVFKALRYARGLRARSIRAVHFMIDSEHARELRQEWEAEGPADIPLEVIEVPDRRIPRAAVELAVRLTVEGKQDLTVLLPRRTYSPIIGRLLHDRSADEIAKALSGVRDVAAMIVPFDVTLRLDKAKEHYAWTAEHEAPASGAPVGEVTPIGELSTRERAVVEGRIRSVTVEAVADSAILRCEVYDPTGGVTLIFHGRRAVPGLEPGSRVRASGTVADYGGHVAINDPMYDLLPSDPDLGEH